MPPIFTRCVRIVESGLVSAGLPCFWLVVEINRPVTGRWLLRVLSKKELEKSYLQKGLL